MRAEHPDNYLQPAPFEINPHWAEEIRLGPGPAPRRARNRTQDSKDSRAGVPTADGSIASSTSDFGRLGELAGASRSGPLEGGNNTWNVRRYHRADEEFIESVEEEGALHTVHATSANGIALDKTGAAIRRPEQTYASMRAPQINDHHPPVVSIPPPIAQDRSWMKAPPPSRAFMEGKKGVTALSRGSSHASRNTNTSANDAPPLRWPGTHTSDRYFPTSGSEMYELPSSRGNMVSSRHLRAQDSTDTDMDHETVRHYSTRRQRSRRRHDSTASSSSGSAFDSDDDVSPVHLAKPRPAHHRDSRRSKLPKGALQTSGPLQEISANPTGSLRSSPSKSAARPGGKSPNLPPQDSMEVLDSEDSSVKARKQHRKSEIARPMSASENDGDEEDEARDAFHWTSYRKLDPATALHSSRSNESGQRWSTEF